MLAIEKLKNIKSHFLFREPSKKVWH